MIRAALSLFILTSTACGATDTTIDDVLEIRRGVVGANDEFTALSVMENGVWFLSPYGAPESNGMLTAAELEEFEDWFEPSLLEVYEPDAIAFDQVTTVLSPGDLLYEVTALPGPGPMILSPVTASESTLEMLDYANGLFLRVGAAE